MRVNPSRSPFAVLGVPESCTDEEVKKAYRRMAMQYHPDRNKDPGAEANFKRAQIAYELLRTSSGRALVRRILNAARGGQGGGAFRGFHGKGGASSGGRGAVPPGRGDWGSREYREPSAREPGPPAMRQRLLHPLLALGLALQPERLLLNMFIYGPAALFFANIAKVSERIEVSAVFSALVLASAFSLATELFQFYLLSAPSRYTLRLKVGNIVAWAAIFGCAVLVLSIDLGGSALLPDMLGIDDGRLRTEMWIVIGSAAYFWFCYCLITHRNNVFFDRAFAWIWSVAVLYCLITILRVNLFTFGELT